MKNPVERKITCGLTDSADVALKNFAHRSGLREVDAVNVAIQTCDYLHEQLGGENELLMRRPDGTISKFNISTFATREDSE
jgi:hypothetical protein